VIGLFCYHAGLDEFVEEPEDEYDLIVTPPFYTEDYKTDERDLARFLTYAFEDLIEAVDLFLSENGIFAVIIPLKKKKISWL
jgi:tRNA1Val (adenine37-N6)-methyltransferase